MAAGFQGRLCRDVQSASAHRLRTPNFSLPGLCVRGLQGGSTSGPLGCETGFRGSGLWPEAAPSVTRGRRFSAVFHFRGKGGSAVGFLPRLLLGIQDLQQETELEQRVVCAPEE
ncbi:hypothetical protein NDU88_003389 [Pleurodeles waltl]|uniref:Uncharacterized protein n=1 Tax=Pleurodeles waltl TaxID=8319 RepID=A0AAV7QBZ7_PLEWA|nr:hypothetical protein NDU88_003389 [Pleurodeles waltl]